MTATTPEELIRYAADAAARPAPVTEPITDCTDISPDLVMYRRGETVTLTLTDPLTLTGRQAAQLGAPS